MVYQRHYWKDYDESKTETQNIEDGAVLTTEKLNELEGGVVSNHSEIELKKADKSYVDTMLSSIAQGGPREIFYSLNALKLKYPSGAEGTYLVFDSALTDGAHSYIWDSGRKLWVDLGVYQAVSIPDKAIARRNINFNILETIESSNLVTQQNIFWGGYVRYQSGAIIPNSNYVYVVAPISAQVPFKIHGTHEQGCFKDVDGNYISGYVTPESINSVPANAVSVWQTIRIEEIKNIYIGPIDGKLESGSLLNPISIRDNSVSYNKLGFMAFLNGNTNLFDKTALSEGWYINYLSGATIANANYSASEFIEIDPRYKWKIEGTKEQFALYDSFGSYVTGMAKASDLETMNLTKNIKFIRFTLRNSEKESVKLKPLQELDSSWITLDNVKKIKEALEAIDNTSVVVKKDGTADFTSLKQALNSTAPGTIIEFTEIFTVEEEFSQSEISQNTFLGYELKDNKILDGKGVGVIQADLDSDLYSFDNIRQVSPISVTGNGKIRNMTLIGKNCRYACHPDFAGASEFVAENVIFIKENAGTDPQALGAGTKSGQKHKYKNCEFKTDWTQSSAAPASYHTNNGFVEPSNVLFEDCRFITQNDNQQQLRLGAMASEQRNIFDLIGNRLSRVLVKEEQMNGSGIDIVLRGRSNRPLTIKVESLSGTEQPALDFVEDVDLI